MENTWTWSWRKNTIVIEQVKALGILESRIAEPQCPKEHIRHIQRKTILGVQMGTLDALDRWGGCP